MLRVRTIVVCIIATIMMSSISTAVSADSISFGGQLKQKSISVSPGGNAYFELLIFSRSEESPSFRMLAEEYPIEFTVSYPETFDMGSEFLKEEFIIIDGEYVKGRIVTVNVGVPSYADSGSYAILLKVESTTKDREDGIIGVTGEQSYMLGVNVLQKAEYASSGNEGIGEIVVVGGEDIREESPGENAGQKNTEAVPWNGESSLIEKTPDGGDAEYLVNPLTGFATIITGGIGNVTMLFFSFVIIIGVSYLIYRNYGKVEQTNHLKNVESEKERYSG